MKKLHLIALLVLFASSCRKEFDNPQTLEVHITNPVDGTGWKGLTCVLEERVGDGQKIETSVLKSVQTDVNGNASITFTPEKQLGKDINYRIYFDVNTIEALPGEFYSTVIPFEQLWIDNNTGGFAPGVGGPYNFKFIPYGGYVRYFKNVNCFDENDEIEWKRIKYFTASDGYNEFDQLNWSGGNTNYMGCIDWIQPLAITHSEMYLYQIKVTRNGIDSIYYDTFVNHAYVTDTFKIFY